MKPRLGITLINEKAIMPNYQTTKAVGFDLASCEQVTLQPNETRLISTGIIFDIPEGYELQIRPRSGVSLKTPLKVANSPGTIDSDFELETKVILWNSSQTDSVTIKIGDRVAQAVISPILQAIIYNKVTGEENEQQTKVRTGGFGSTDS